ncbi:metallophosphoesterase [Desulfovibrio inopinatus]|uniref:metallophosphoesterase n=1 Tax=Desulfovibrio inopinatus TaxID=102109 RepID=UPI000413E3DD|nr:metallophosphoesterase [Desulfovibrio inopinatus]
MGRSQVFWLTAILCALLPTCPFAAEIPAVYSHIEEHDGQLFGEDNGHLLPVLHNHPSQTIMELRGHPKGDKEGFVFSFEDPEHGLKLEDGTLYYGLWSPDMGAFPQPIFQDAVPIHEGRAVVKMKTLAGKKDCTSWQQRARGHLYYRVADETGHILFESRLHFRGNGPFTVADSIVEGPMLADLTSTHVIIAFTTNNSIAAKVHIQDKIIAESTPGTEHALRIDGLEPEIFYQYRVEAGTDVFYGTLMTAPTPGSRAPFTFAFGSDCRGNISSGERNMGGVNQYVMSRAMALATAKQARFFLFTGDTMNGYASNVPDQERMYANFKSALFPFAGSLPLFLGVGNHETISMTFDDGSKYGLSCDRFPFNTDSSEAVFSKIFVNPRNGPLSEDGSALDPRPETPGDFPDYGETAYSFVYGNVAVIMVNSQYFMAASMPANKIIGGNVWGYIMDNQLKWITDMLETYQNDSRVDHIFVTQHTPMFPNSAHYTGAKSMWAGGDNSIKPVIQGIPEDRITGFIDRRDAYLRQLLKNTKVRALLVGDEHVYYRTRIAPGMTLYNPEKYVPQDPVSISRPLWEICNGALGAPAYGMESTPWNRGFPESGELKRFSSQHALVFIHVNGKFASMDVIDPVSLAPIELGIDMVLKNP